MCRNIAERATASLVPVHPGPGRWFSRRKGKVDRLSTPIHLAFHVLRVETGAAEKGLPCSKVPALWHRSHVPQSLGRLGGHAQTGSALRQLRLPPLRLRSRPLAGKACRFGQGTPRRGRGAHIGRSPVVHPPTPAADRIAFQSTLRPSMVHFPQQPEPLMTIGGTDSRLLLAIGKGQSQPLLAEYSHPFENCEPAPRFVAESCPATPM